MLRVASLLPSTTEIAGALGAQVRRFVRAGRAFLLDGNAYVGRPGPRLVESLEILAEVLHPEAFRFGHRDAGWEPL
jgi:ABC-type Fe3+-hydroxamate transport system substrate-binding protein